MGRRNRRKRRRSVRALNPEQAARIAALSAAQERLGKLKIVGAVGGGLALAALAGSIAIGAPAPATTPQPTQTDVFGQTGTGGSQQGDQGSQDQGGQTIPPNIVTAQS
jgi:hypothetical protein